MKDYKLGTALVSDEETPVILLDGTAYVLADLLGHNGHQVSPNTLLEIFADWDAWRDAFDRIEEVKVPGRAFDPGELTYLSPITNPRKIICIGANYRDHLAEMKSAEEPRYPYAFLRPVTCLAGHGETVPLPSGPAMIDWEAELCIVVGCRVGPADKERAHEAVGGYCIVNDVSARDWLAARPAVGVDWVMMKCWDKFQPTGPWITPAQFVPDPQALAIELSVNGVVKQSSSTSRMIFGVAQIMKHLAGIMTLEPGDLIATGTPAGVGYGRDPQEFIKAGDRVRIAIEGLGVQENGFA